MSNNGDVGGVSTKHSDVLLQPMQCGYLVHEAVVCGGAQVRVCIGVQEPCTNNRNNKSLINSMTKRSKKSLRQILVFHCTGSHEQFIQP
jgi:hypothetical protein